MTENLLSDLIENGQTGAFMPLLTEHHVNFGNAFTKEPSCDK